MSEISINQYIFERLKQLGVESIFGVPGDYELVMLDGVPGAGLSWKGNPNELNASYAADGYGRIKGVGAVVQTFGPGELSAYCGIAGAYTEYVPVVSLVGYPPMTAMNKNLIMHHSLGDGKFGMYHEMVKHITVATTVITSVAGAAAEIDRVLNAMMYYSRPVYIGVPVDVGPKSISTEPLRTPLTTKLPPNDATLEADIVGKIVKEICNLKKTIIIVDGLAIRCQCEEETKALIHAAGVQYFTTSMSKGFDENLPKFGGIYGGLASPKSIRDAVEGADCVLWIGSYSSDFNTGEFTERVRPETVVDFQRHFLSLRSKQYPLNMPHTLNALTNALKAVSGKIASHDVNWDPYPLDAMPKPAKTTQDYLWTAMGRYLRSNDLVIAETGTSAYGIPGANIKNKPHISMFNQTVYGSIGFAAGAAVGAFVAMSELKMPGRPVLITGEGSLQLTVQAFSDLLRHDLGATVFLLNNDGYTVERLIHGPDADYNRVPVWDYAQLAALFAPDAQKTGKFRHYLIAKPDDLEALLQDKFFVEEGPRNRVTQVVEILLDRLDAPKAVLDVTKAIEEFNKTQAH